MRTGVSQPRAVLAPPEPNPIQGANCGRIGGRLAPRLAACSARRIQFPD
jgi:hypothetical protein